MLEPRPIPELTAEQRQALADGNGIVQGPSYVLLRNDVVLDWFGWDPDDLRRELQVGLNDVENGRVAEWDLQAFLTEMNRGTLKQVEAHAFRNPVF